MYEYLEELDQMSWSARGNVLNQYLRNTSIGTTVSNQASKSTGMDSIPARVLKVSAETISPSLSWIFNLCIKTGVHIDDWKKAWVDNGELNGVVFIDIRKAFEQ